MTMTSTLSTIGIDSSMNSVMDITNINEDIIPSYSLLSETLNNNTQSSSFRSLAIYMPALIQTNKNIDNQLKDDATVELNHSENNSSSYQVAFIDGRLEDKRLVFPPRNEYKISHEFLSYNTNLEETVKRTDRSEKNQSLISSFADLKENWYGNNEKPISPTVIEISKKVLRSIPIQPEVFPATDSTIQFDFTNFKKFEFEINIGNRFFQYYLLDKNGKETEATIENQNNSDKVVSNKIIEIVNENLL